MIEVNPSNPTGSESVELTFTGSACVLGTSQSRIDNEFIFTVDRATICFATPPGYSFSWDVGVLAEGNYTASLYISNDGGIPSINSSDQFSVFSAGDSNAVPAIPMLGLLILALAVGGIAYRKLSSMP